MTPSALGGSPDLPQVPNRLELAQCCGASSHPTPPPPLLTLCTHTHTHPYPTSMLSGRSQTDRYGKTMAPQRPLVVAGKASSGGRGWVKRGEEVRRGPGAEKRRESWSGGRRWTGARKERQGILTLAPPSRTHPLPAASLGFCPSAPPRPWGFQGDTCPS